MSVAVLITPYQSLSSFGSSAAGDLVLERSAPIPKSLRKAAQIALKDPRYDSSPHGIATFLSGKLLKPVWHSYCLTWHQNERDRPARALATKIPEGKASSQNCRQNSSANLEGSIALRTALMLLGLTALALNLVPASGPRPGVPTLFVAGDSTANLPNHRGWGDPVADYFDATQITVLNRACGGRSARTFLNEGLWNRIVAELRPGDYVLIQFGHNDGGAPDQPPARADLPGIGNETMRFATADGRTELIHTFGWYIRKFVQDVKAKGAHPIVLSLTVRNVWRNGKVERGLGKGQFGKWSEAVANEEGVPFLDVTNIIADAYESMGEKQVKPLFTPDRTHTTHAGADLNASLIVAGLKGSGSPLTQFLSAKGQ